MLPNLDTLPYIPAYWQFPSPPAPRVRTTDLIVVHCMETQETATTAEALGAYFAYHPEITSGNRKASVHVGADSDSAVRYAPDSAYVYGAGGANDNGLHLELAGYSAQSRDEWLDVYGSTMLPIAAGIIAAWCNRYYIAPVFLDAGRLQAATPTSPARGITTHREVTFAYGKDDHTDPGSNFPLDILLQEVHMALADEIARAIHEYPVTVHSYNENRDITIPHKDLDAYAQMELQRIRMLLEQKG